MRNPNGNSQRPVQPVIGRLPPVALVHLPDLGRDHEGAHRADHDPDDEAEDATETVAGVLLHLLLCLVHPVQAVDPERDDEEQDPEADAAGLSEWTGVSLEVCSWLAILPVRSDGATLRAVSASIVPIEERWPRPSVDGGGQRHAGQLLRRRSFRRARRCRRARATPRRGRRRHRRHRRRIDPPRRRRRLGRGRARPR